MPDRVIRDELLESEKWLSLKDNADRLAYIALLLRADSLGNFSAEPFRLLRLWRDFGVNTIALVTKTLTELSDHDLIRLYQDNDKPLLHIPRFGQRTRYLKRVYTPSPWTTNEEKHKLINNSPDSHLSVTGLSPDEVKRSEVKRQELQTTGLSKASISKKKNNDKPPFVIPDWVPVKQWEAWIESRTKKRNPPTEFAKRLAVNRLQDLQNQGHSPALVLAESAFNGWAGLFPPKEKK